MWLNLFFWFSSSPHVVLLPSHSSIPLPHLLSKRFNFSTPLVVPKCCHAQVERRLISAGILHEDGAEIDLEDGGGEGGFGDDGSGVGVFNEIEVSDGEEACRILQERLGFDEVRALLRRSL